MSEDNGDYYDAFREWRPEAPLSELESTFLEATLTENDGNRDRMRRNVLLASQQFMNGAYSVVELAQLAGTICPRLTLSLRLELEASDTETQNTWELLTLFLLVAGHSDAELPRWEAVADHWLASPEVHKSTIGLQYVHFFAHKQAEIGAVEAAAAAYAVAYQNLGHLPEFGTARSDFLIEYADFLLRNLEEFPQRCVDIYLEAVEACAEEYPSYDEELERLLINLFCLLRDTGDTMGADLVLVRVLEQQPCEFRIAGRTLDLFRELIALRRHAGNHLEAAQAGSLMLEYADTTYGDLSDESRDARLLLAEIHVDLGNYRKASSLRAWAAFNQEQLKWRSSQIEAHEAAGLALSALFDGDAQKAQSTFRALARHCRRVHGAASASSILFSMFEIEALYALQQWKRADKLLVSVIGCISRAQLDDIGGLVLNLHLMRLVEESRAQAKDSSPDQNLLDVTLVAEEASEWLNRQGLLVRTYLTAAFWLPKVMILSLIPRLFWLFGEPDPIGRVIPWRLLLRNTSRAMLERYVEVPVEQRDHCSNMLEVFHDAWLALSLKLGANREIPGVLAGIQGRQTALDLARSSGALFKEDDRISIKSVLGEAWRTLASLWRADKPTSKPEGGARNWKKLSFPDMSGPALVSLLKPGEAALLIFELVSDDGNKAIYCNLQLKTGLAHTFQADSLDELMALVGDPDANPSSVRGGRGFRGAAPVGKAEQERPVSQLGDVLDKARTLARSFWSEIDQVWRPKHLYVATHQDTHFLPLNCSGNSHFATSYFPGMLFLFSELNRRRKPGALIAPSINVHCDAAEDTAQPIPFVRAEAEILRQVWGDEPVSLTERGATKSVLQDSEARFNTLVFAAHGEELPGSPPQSIIWLDRSGGSYIDAPAVLGMEQSPAVVIASACVAGRVREDGLGEPLGLVSSFFMSGARFILAPLQPIPDLYVPLIMGLFHRAWQRDPSPRRAWEQACRQALSGDWPEGLDEQLAAAYRPVMEAMLERAAGDPTYLRTVLNTGWKLHRDAMLFPDDFAKEQCGTRESRDAIVYDGLQQILRERHEPSEGLRYICSWVVPFGT